MRFSLDNAVSIDDMNQINPNTNPMTFYTNEWDVKNPGVPMPTNPPDNTYSKEALYGLNGQNNGRAPSAMMGHMGNNGGNLNYTDFNQQNEFQYVEQDSLNKLSMNDYLSQNKLQEQIQKPEVKQKMVRFIQENGPQMQKDMNKMGQEMKREVRKAVKEIRKEDIEEDSDNEEENRNGHVFLLGSMFLLFVIFFISKKYGFKL